MPTTISVSPAVPDKLVVNGVNLVNREELSNSQQRELQRYIDANAHLLGFLDKEKEENEKAEMVRKYTGAGSAPPLSLASPTDSNASAAFLMRNQQPYNSYSLGREPPIRSSMDDSWSAAAAGQYGRPPSATQSLNRLGMGSPSSDYGYGGGKRKGVSWSDVVDPSPIPGGRQSPIQNQTGFPNTGDFIDSMPALDDSRRSREDYSRRGAKMARERSPPYSTIDKQRSPYDQDSAYWSPSPWGTGSWDRATAGRDRSKERKEGSIGWQGFPKPDLPTYSSLERNPDDFNPFQTHAHREEAIGLRRSQERDESVKFYGYGDHRVSGLEMKPKRWQGGEAVTDPNIMKKSLKPRRLFYSPIGDGVVEADGIEMKYPPRDLTPRRYVYHQRYVEQDPGKPGLKVTEDIWHEGGDGGPKDDGDRFSTFPAAHPDDGLDGHRGPAPARPADNGLGKARDAGPAGDDDGKRGDGDWPRLDYDPGLGKFPPFDDGLGKVPLADDGGPKAVEQGPGARPASAVPSIASSGPPREGWTITFISNPRECINIYGSETLTNIFDLEDHTPKTITTIKETYSPGPPVVTDEGGIVTIGGKEEY